MKRIIENEIRKLIKRDPTEEEIDNAIKYIDGCSDDLTLIKHLPELLTDWFMDNMKVCSQCGKYELFDNMIHSHCEHFCSSECEDKYVEEMFAQMDDKNRSFIYRY